MTYILRPYQIESVEAGVNFFLDKKQKKNVLIVEPTGAGKSLIIANIAMQLDAPVLCLQPSVELLKQNYSKFISYGLEASIFSASAGIKEVGQVTFATVQSIYTHPKLFKEFKYVLIDECHKMNVKEGGMYIKLFAELNLKIIGLTATPFKLKGYNFPIPHSKINFLTRMRPKLFQEVIYITQIQEMVKNGWWSPLNYISEPFDTSKLEINTTRANYTNKSVLTALKSEQTTEKAIYWAKKLRGENRRQIIIYLPSIKAAEYVASRLEVGCITSKTKPKDRIRILEEFENGENWAITNVSVFAIGYDNQKIDGIVDADPSMSLALYYQKIGRGVRVDLSNNPTKIDCTVVDLTGNFELFGKVEDLVIEKENKKWVITSNKKLFTNIPISRGKPIPELENELMTFGKFKNEKFKDVPKWYWKFVSNNFKREARNETMFRYIESTI